MNDILKQRLVGALILVALGVVFWPIIFVEPGEQIAAQQPRIPPRPDVSTEPVATPDLAGLRESPQIEARQSVAAQDSAPPPVEPEAPPPQVVERDPPATTSPVKSTAAGSERPTRSKPPQELVLDGDGVPVAWILQVASVSSAAKADELRQRLLQKNQKAYVRRVKSGGKDFYRVYLGPKFERAKLEALQSDIDAEFGVTSLVARYVP